MSSRSSVDADEDEGILGEIAAPEQPAEPEEARNGSPPAEAALTS